MAASLAELAGNPDAVLNAGSLGWQQVSDREVDVSLQTAGGVARVRLSFNASGDITGIDAPDRPRSVGNQSVATRWIGRFSDYAQFGAYRGPRHGEIAWVLPEGEFVYWRGEILGITAAGG